MVTHNRVRARIRIRYLDSSRVGNNEFLRLILNGFECLDFFCLSIHKEDKGDEFKFFKFVIRKLKNEERERATHFYDDYSSPPFFLTAV